MTKNPFEWLTDLIVAYARRPLVVNLCRIFGPTPNQRDSAEEFGRTRIREALLHQRTVVLDFEGSALITQAFFHALLDDAITEDPRWCSRISLRNVTKPQKAVFDLAMRYMVNTASDRRQKIPPTQTQFVKEHA